MAPMAAVVPSARFHSVGSCRIQGSPFCSATGVGASTSISLRMPSFVGLSVHGFREGSGCGSRTVERPSECGRSQTARPIARASGQGKEFQTASDATVENKSILCSNCTGNGAVICSQCHGDGVNSVDHFNGRFKAGFTCWLCRGKKQILCGECNGAGFLGGFLNTQDD